LGKAGETISLQGNGTIERVAAMPAGGRSVIARRADLTLGPTTIGRVADATTVAGQGTVALADVQAKQPDGAAASFGAIDAALSSFNVSSKPETTTTSLNGKIVARTTAAMQDGNELNLASMQFGFSPATVTLAKDTISGSATGPITLDRLRLRQPGDRSRPAITTEIAQFRADLTQLAVANGTSETRLNGGLAATVENIVSRLTQTGGARRGRKEPPALFSIGNVRIDVPEVAMALRENQPASWSVIGSGKAKMTGFRGDLPAVELSPSLRLDGLSVNFGRTEVVSLRDGAKAKGQINLGVETLSGRWTDPLAKGGAHAEGRLDSGAIELATVTLRSGADATEVQANGTARSRNFALNLPSTKDQPESSLTLGELAAQIREARVEVQPKATTWRADGDIGMDSLSVDSAKGRLGRLQIARVSLEDLSVDQALRISAARVAVREPLLSFSRGLLDLFLRPEKTRIEQVAEAAAEEVSSLRIGTFEVINGGRIRFRDDSVRPQVVFRFDTQVLTVQNLDTSNADARTEIHMISRLNEFSGLDFSGWIMPGRSRPDFDFIASVQQLQLPPFSAYVAEAAGINIASGRLRADVKASATTGRLDGVVNVDLTDLEIGRAGSRSSFIDRLPISFDTIIGLLNDSRGRMRLTLPISGDLASPKFDLSSAIMQALGGALREAVLAPIAVATLPVRLVARAATGGPPKFDPIPFEAGRAKVGPNGAVHLDTIADLLRSRKSLRIKVCGRTTAQDLDAYLARQAASGSETAPESIIDRADDFLATLAWRRTVEVRRQLLTERGVREQQVDECRPFFDRNDYGLPRVEIEL
jgi:hypothetical protein